MAEDFTQKVYDEFMLSDLVQASDPEYDARNDRSKFGIWPFDFKDKSKRYADENGLYDIE